MKKTQLRHILLEQFVTVLAGLRLEIQDICAGLDKLAVEEFEIRKLKTMAVYHRRHITAEASADLCSRTRAVASTRAALDARLLVKGRDLVRLAREIDRSMTFAQRVHILDTGSFAQADLDANAGFAHLLLIGGEDSPMVDVSRHCSQLRKALIAALMDYRENLWVGPEFEAIAYLASETFFLWYLSGAKDLTESDIDLEDMPGVACVMTFGARECAVDQSVSSLR